MRLILANDHPSQNSTHPNIEQKSFIGTTNGRTEWRHHPHSHADTTVVGRNCVTLRNTERSLPMKVVPIVTAATGFTSATGSQYILVFKEAMYMPRLDHTLVNPNQLRPFHSHVQDNPYHTEPISITSPDEGFVARGDFPTAMEST